MSGELRNEEAAAYLRAHGWPKPPMASYGVTLLLFKRTARPIRRGQMVWLAGPTRVTAKKKPGHPVGVAVTSAVRRKTLWVRVQG